MAAQPESRYKVNLNLQGFNVLNLGKIPDLSAYLAGLSSSVAKGIVYGYVYGDSGQGNIAVLPFGTHNRYKDTTANQSGALPLYNRFSNTFDYNYVESGFWQNEFAQRVQSNCFRTGFASNKVGVDFQNNYFGTGCSQNTFGDRVSALAKDDVYVAYPGNTAGPNNLVFNTFGTDVKNIFLGDNISYCEIGNGCSNIQLGDNCKGVKLFDCHANADGSRFVIPAGTTNVIYRNNVIDNDPYGVTGKLSKTLNLSDLQDVKLSRRNLGITDANDKVPAALLPGFVDDIQEFDGGKAAFPVVGERGVQYVDTSNGGYVQYRWSGTAYGPIVASPGTSDAVTEGTTNLYFTQLRAIGAKLADYAQASAVRAIAATDSIAVAIGLLEKSTTQAATGLQTVNSYLPSTASATNKLVTQQDLTIAAGGPLITPFANQLTVTIQHNRNRLVGVQIYENDGIQSDALVQQLDLNNVQISFGGTVGLSGSIIIF